MTKAVLGNLAAFNTVLQLSLPSSQPLSGMSSSNAQRQPDSENFMSSLVSGSIEDQSTFEFPRPSVWRSPNAIDPFSTRPHGRYSPPRNDLTEKVPFEAFQTRVLPLYDTTSSGPALYHAAPTFSLPGDLSYMPMEPHQRPTIIQHEPSSRRHSQDSFGHRTGSPLSQGYTEYGIEGHRRSTDANRGSRYHSQRRPFNQDEFDGPSQYLPLPLPQQDHNRAQALPELPVYLDFAEQDEVMRRANDILAECAFHFVAKYQFPVPLEQDKPRVRSAADREWTEWAYLLKRLATKRRIPARVLYDNQIKQLVTILENSLAARSLAHKDQNSPKRKPKDDRYILQLVSAGAQVAKTLMDSLAMEQLNDLYARTEALVMDRRYRAQTMPRAF